MTALAYSSTNSSLSNVTLYFLKNVSEIFILFKERGKNKELCPNFVKVNLAENPAVFGKN